MNSEKRTVKNERTGCLIILAIMTVAWGVIYMLVDTVISIVKSIF